MLDGTEVQVRTFTDPLVNPFFDGNLETEISSFEARLATGAVGKNDKAAPGASGFFDMWKKPAEFQSTLYAVPDIVTDGRLTENNMPHNLGQDVARSALDRAPPEQPLDRFPSLPQMNHATITHEDSRVTQQFYG